MHYDALMNHLFNRTICQQKNKNIIITCIKIQKRPRISMNLITLSQNINPKAQHSFVPYKKPQLANIEDLVKSQELSSRDSQENNQLYFYEQEVGRLSYANTLVMAQLSSALEQKKIIMQLICDAEKREKSGSQQIKQKRVRRCANDIQKKYFCPQKNCQKCYGTEASLIQHIKLKHPKNCNQPPLVLDPA